MTPTGLTVLEGGSGSYTVVLESEPAGEVTVTPAVAAGTDVTVSPESLTFTADNWSVAQEVTVRAAEDADALADAEVTVRHAVSGYGAVTVAAAVTVTIVENDTAGVAVSPTALSVPEGGSGSYTVVLATRPDGTVTVTAAVATGTDVAVSPGSLSFTADNWSVAQEVTVRAAEDADAEVDAEVTVRHAVSGYGAVTVAADVTVTIVENDTAGVAVSPTALSVPEGGSGSYTVVLATRPDGTVTVTAAVATGTDVAVSPGESDVHGGQLERAAGSDGASGGGRRRGSRRGSDGEPRGERVRSGDRSGGGDGDDRGERHGGSGGIADGVECAGGRQRELHGGAGDAA